MSGPMHRTAPLTVLRLTLVTMTVGGGFTGSVFTMQMLPSVRNSAPANLVIWLGFVLLHLFVLISGLLFVHNSARVVPMLVALLFQIPLLSSPYVTYRFGDGLFGG